MKLLQINVSVNDGSNGTIAEEIGEIVMRHGWTSYIAYGRKALKSQSRLIKISNTLDIYFHVILTRLFDYHGLASQYSTKRFIKKIEDINPDIIHLHNIHGYFLNYKILFEYLATTNIPVVWTLHDCWPFTGHCAHFEMFKCSKWKRLCYNCPQKNEYPRSFLLDNSRFNFFNKNNSFNSLNHLTITAVSQWLGGCIKESFLANIPLKIIYNGVNTQIFKPCNTNLKTSLHLTGKKILLGVASTWSERKGFKDYLKLSNLLSDEYQIILIGLSQEQRLRCSNKIYGIGRTDNVFELVEYYSMADIVMNLSYEETFGLTTVEGFACGTPSIVYNTTASPELISCETGIIVEPGNLESVVCAIQEICNNGKEYYSIACRERALSTFNKDIIYTSYFELYQSILDHNK